MRVAGRIAAVLSLMGRWFDEGYPKGRKQDPVSGLRRRVEVPTVMLGFRLWAEKRGWEPSVPSLIGQFRCAGQARARFQPRPALAPRAPLVDPLADDEEGGHEEHRDAGRGQHAAEDRDPD